MEKEDKSHFDKKAMCRKKSFFNPFFSMAFLAFFRKSGYTDDMEKDSGRAVENKSLFRP